MATASLNRETKIKMPSFRKSETQSLSPEGHWPLRVYEKSILKQAKYAEILAFLDNTSGQDCLDVGSETGAISYLLRSRGGNWKSTDHEPIIVKRIRDLVGNNVYLMQEPRLPFEDNSFDTIVVVDILEHVEDDNEFVNELYRTLRPHGTLILNTPRKKFSWLSRFQERVGLTDENLGRVRPGYTEHELETLLSGRFDVSAHRTYRGFFSKLFEIICLLILRHFPTDRMGKHAPMVSPRMLDQHKLLVRGYSLMFPLVRMFCALDRVLRFPGYMLIAKAHPVRDTSAG